jgi:hypothetical protein
MINHHLHIALAAERRRTLLADAHAHRLAREARPAGRGRRARRYWRSLAGQRVRQLTSRPVSPVLTGVSR